MSVCSPSRMQVTLGFWKMRGSLTSLSSCLISTHLGQRKKNLQRLGKAGGLQPCSRCGGKVLPQEDSWLTGGILIPSFIPSSDRNLYTSTPGILQDRIETYCLSNAASCSHNFTLYTETPALKQLSAQQTAMTRNSAGWNVQLEHLLYLPSLDSLLSSLIS